MNRKQLGSYLLYGVVGFGSMIGAFLVSSQFMSRVYSQNTPPTAPRKVSVESASTNAGQEGAPNVVPGENAPPELQPPPPPMPVAPSDQSPSEAAETAQIPEPPLPVPKEMGEWSLLLAPYTFDPKLKRDPFGLKSASISSGPVVSTGPLLPLQRYELEELKLLGIIWNVRNPKAMFMDPTKQIHVLERDDRIGKRNGYIAVIREGEVVVVEAGAGEGSPAYLTKIMKITR